MTRRLEIYAGPDREHSATTVAASDAPRRLLQSCLPFASVGDFRNCAAAPCDVTASAVADNRGYYRGGPCDRADRLIAAGLRAILPVSNVIWSWG
jgi:hypothetical protein